MQPIFALDQSPSVSVEADSEEEFELVVGRRQVAAIAFLALVMMVVCSGGSYLAGKAMSAREEPVPPMIQVEQAPVAMPAPIIEATIVPPAAAPAPAPKPSAEAPLFANSVPQGIYIQVGVVEKGVATVIAEGLRQHALGSFVAPSPSEKVFRVLIGPLPDLGAYQKARNIVDQLGLSNFARRYQQP